MLFLWYYNDMKRISLTESELEILETALIDYGAVVTFDQLSNLVDENRAYTRKRISKLVKQGWLKRIKKFEGQLFWTYVLLYGITRFVIEHFRGDERGVVVGGVFTTSQLVGIIMVVIAVAVMIVLRRRCVRNHP